MTMAAKLRRYTRHNANDEQYQRTPRNRNPYRYLLPSRHHIKDCRQPCTQYPTAYRMFEGEDGHYYVHLLHNTLTAARHSPLEHLSVPTHRFQVDIKQLRQVLLHDLRAHCILRVSLRGILLSPPSPLQRSVSTFR